MAMGGDDVLFRSPSEQAGFVLACNQALLDRRISDSTYRTLLVMESLMMRHERMPSVGELAAERGCCPATISQHLSQLQEMGLLEPQS